MGDKSLKDINLFLSKNPELMDYKDMLIEFHKSPNFNLFFSKLKKTYGINKEDKSILNELRTAYNLQTICNFYVTFMLEEDVGNNPDKLKQGCYMIANLPEGVRAKDLKKIKTPDLLIFSKGDRIYVEIKTINSEIKNPHKILQRVNNGLVQIKQFGKGLVQIFCEEPIDNFDDFIPEIKMKVENDSSLLGVLITYPRLISQKKISENQSRKTYRKDTQYIGNKNFKK